MRHRFFMEDDLIKIGWGDESSLQEWDAILRWALRKLDDSGVVLHLLLDFSAIYVITEEIFHPEIAARLAAHPNAGHLLLVNHNPVFVHFVNEHWAADGAAGVRAFLDVTDALSWLRRAVYD
ncbi:MAG: hypothetical protein ACLFTK_09410 [Anaerolineales bacterium]